MSSPSRYAAVGTATWTSPDGTTVPYLLRRFLPQPGQLATQGTYLVRPGDRVDMIANASSAIPSCPGCWPTPTWSIARAT